MDEWIRAHVVDVPIWTRDFCGDLLNGARVLDVGCGDMLVTLGLLDLGPAHVTGLDLHQPAADWRERLVERVAGNGHTVPSDHRERLDYAAFDGRHFPFADAAFDVVFSWGVFEHVGDVNAVLREMHRVLTPGGRAFVTVDPWFRARAGSHLTDYIDEPWFHLRRDEAWVRARLEDHLDHHGGPRAFVTGYLFGEYRTLNRITASQFHRAVRHAGFVVEKARLIAYDEDLSEAPDDLDFADLMIRGTMLVARKDTAAS